jgi:hypothetical protein
MEYNVMYVCIYSHPGSSVEKYTQLKRKLQGLNFPKEIREMILKSANYEGAGIKQAHHKTEQTEIGLHNN